MNSESWNNSREIFTNPLKIWEHNVSNPVIQQRSVKRQAGNFYFKRKLKSGNVPSKQFNKGLKMQSIRTNTAKISEKPSKREFFLETYINNK